MKMTTQASRRKFLQGSMGAFVAGMSPWTRAWSAPADVLRIGAVLPLGASSRLTTTVADRERRAPVGDAARMGLTLAEEEIGHNAALLGREIELHFSSAPGAEAAYRAAQRMVAAEGVSALIGGFSREEAEALGEVAEANGILFFNIGSTSDVLRGEGCRRNTFHIEASAAMYLDAIAGWFVHSQLRKWYLVYEDTTEGKARYSRIIKALGERHWGAEEVGHYVARPGQHEFSAAMGDIAEATPDVVFVLTDWNTQLKFLANYEAAGLDHPVTGFPEAATQLRDFFGASRQIAPRAGAGHRAALWEATLDAYGARELNARFGSRWGKPMDAPAWAGYQAVKIFSEAVLQVDSKDADDVAAFLTGDSAIFDVHKGIGVSFRPWDHQLRQSLFLVKIDPDGDRRLGLRPKLNQALLVGELPAIYMPGTDPVERLDQLGDIGAGGACA